MEGFKNSWHFCLIWQLNFGGIPIGITRSDLDSCDFSLIGCAGFLRTTPLQKIIAPTIPDRGFSSRTSTRYARTRVVSCLWANNYFFSDFSLINNFIISFGDIIKYMAIVVQWLERTTVARKTGVRFSPFASNEVRSELRIPQNSIFAFRFESDR